MAVLALALLVAALATALALGPARPASAAADQGADDGLHLELTGVDPAFLTPGQTLTVTGTVRNASPSPVSAPVLTLRLQPSSLNSRFALDAWLDPASATGSRLVTRQTLDDPLAAGSSRPFTLTVPAEALPVGSTASSWGPRGLSVDATARREAGSLRAEARTFLVWVPALPAAPTRVSVVLPVVATSSDLIGSALADVSVAEQAEARVTALVRATSGRRQVTWVLDPALLTAVDPVAVPSEQGPEPAPTTPAPTTPAPTTPAPTTPAPTTPAPTTPADAQQPGPTPDATPGEPPGDGEPVAAGERLVAVLRTEAGGREVVALPFADSDAASLVHAGHPALQEVAGATGAELVRAAGLTTVDGIGWPAAEQPDEATVGTLAGLGARAVLLAESALPRTEVLTYTPTGRGTIRTSDGDEAIEVAALLAEEALSAAVAGEPPRSTAEQGVAAALAARQYALALTAMVTRERPADARHLLALVPRSFAGDPATLADRLAALDEAPWVTLAPLSELVAAPDADVTETTLPAEVVEPDEAPADLVQLVADTRAALTDFAVLAPEPLRLVRDEQLRLLEVDSAAWRTDPGGRSSFAMMAVDGAADLQRQIGVLTGGTVNLIAETGDLPVTVRNALDQPITVQLRLTPRGPSISVEDDVPVEAPATGEIVVPVPVTAVGSADVEVDAVLVDGQGHAVGEPATLYVRVRADWENVGTAVVAAVVAAAFVVGLVRSIRRAQRRRAADAGGAP